MGESGHGFALEIMRKPKLKKRKLLNMMVPNFFTLIVTSSTNRFYSMYTTAGFYI